MQCYRRRSRAIAYSTFLPQKHLGHVISRSAATRNLWLQGILGSNGEDFSLLSSLEMTGGGGAQLQRFSMRSPYEGLRAAGEEEVVTICRTHGNRPNNEPWTIGGDSYRHIRAAMILRERLRPYVMAHLYEADKLPTQSIARCGHSLNQPCCGR